MVIEILVHFIILQLCFLEQSFLKNTEIFTDKKGRASEQAIFEVNLFYRI
jgi:hypothetical protein